MKVEIEMHIDEENELAVMEKASSMMQAKQLGFEVGELELKSHGLEEEEEEEEERKD